MMNRANKLLFVLLTTAGASVFADVGVTIDNVVQHFPYDGKIDLAYTVSGVEAPEKFTLALSCVQGATTNLLVTFSGEAPSAANGTRTVRWNATADGVGFPSGKADFLADLRPAAATDGDYMIIDVSGGSEAASFPVTFVSDVADPAATFNVDEYKLGKIVLKKVKAGTFLMGSPTDEEGRNTCLYYCGTQFFDNGGDETLHYVKISQDFYLGLFPVTGCQLTNICACSGLVSSQTAPAYKINYDNFLYGGTNFFEKINAKVLWNGLVRPAVMLPTESQWEYVCRAGTTTAWFFGADATDIADYVWFTGGKTCWAPPAVGGKMPNPWGFYDMIGNVYQYCRDTSGEYPAGTLEEPAVDPVHVGVTKHYHVMRGTGYGSGETIKNEYARSACRVAAGNQNHPFDGFRLLSQKLDVTPFVSSALRTDVAIDEHSTRTDINAVTLTLVTNRVEHTGSAVTVPIVLTHGAKTLVEGSDYTLAYSDNVNLGVCTVTVTGQRDYAGTRLTSYRIVSPCVAESQRAVAKIDLRDGVLRVTVPRTLFGLAYNNTADWTRGGEASETVKAVVSAAPLATAASVPAEGDFATVLTSDGEGTVAWSPSSRYTMVRLQIVRDGTVDPECTRTRVIEATFTAFKLFVR